MENPPVSDIRLLEGSTPLAGRRDGRLARFLGEIVAAGSLLPAGEFQLSSLPCRRRPKHRPCPGRIRLGRHLDSDEIFWVCECCGDQGVITNWQRSRWDLQPELEGGRIVSLSLERARRGAPGAKPPMLRRSRQSRLAPVRLQVYELSAELIHAPFLLEERVVRHIQLTGDSTLQALHSCLHAAFDRPDEQPYEFMFGPPYDPETRRFSGPGSSTDDGEGFWDTRLVRIDSLSLRPGDSFGYLYDFNDEWVHRITILSVREASLSIPPRVSDRLGASPVWPLDSDDDLCCQELEPSCPMSSLYGPYIPEEGPQPDDWLGLDELERQLLVMESHARAGVSGHPPIVSPLLHALLHSLAETQLCECAGEPSVDEIRCALPAERHRLIHRLGARLIRQQLNACAETAASLRGSRKSKEQ